MILSTPPEGTLIGEDLDILDIDIGNDCYVGLVIHVLNGVDSNRTYNHGHRTEPVEQRGR